MIGSDASGGPKSGDAADPAIEARALRSSLDRAVVALTRLARSLKGDAADMLAFQIAMLEDPELAAPAFAAISSGRSAIASWRAALDAEIATYRQSSDDYFRARAGDLADMRDRVLAILSGAGPVHIDGVGIVVAEDLPPSLFLSTDWRGGGIALTGGSATSHVAMLARSRGVPMVVGLEVVDARAFGDGAPGGLEGCLDAEQGCLILSPDAAAKAAFEARRKVALEDRAATESLRERPAITADGVRISVRLNISSVAEVDRFDPQICDGIGLVRTELLFEGAELPSEDEQYAAYRHLAEWAQGRPVTIRTLDAGGDKPIAGLTMPAETNPFLGVRGVRLTLRHPELFKTQLRALARAAAHGAIEIMVPMIAVPQELAAVRALLDEACAEVSAAGLPYRRPPLGMMVEVPSVAITPEFYDADFYSIGSNDLVQYTLAAGRDVIALAHIARVTDPAVLRLIRAVVLHGRLTGRSVSLCGDAGGDPEALPELLDCGLTTLSIAPAEVGRAKRVIAAYRRRS
jgi:phosphotransferase system enzyme I (PtsI)